MQDFSLKDAYKVVVKWRVLLLIVPILAGIFAFFYNYLMLKDVYKTSAALYVLIRYEDNDGNTRVDTTTSNFFSDDYAVLFRESLILEQTEEALGFSLGSAGIHLDVLNVPNTHMVLVTATGGDPKQCADAANISSGLFKQYIEEFMKVNSVSITKQAKVPTQIAGPLRNRNILFAFMGSFALCVCCALALELLNTRITTREQIEEKLQQPLLGSVYDYRKELALYVKDRQASNPYRYLSQLTRESVKTIALNVRFSTVDRPAKSIAITSTTPNEGKSSIATMLAASFAEEGFTTLIIDADFRKPTIGTLLKRRNEYDMVDFLHGKAALEDVYTETGIAGVYFIDSRHRTARLSRMVQSSQFDHMLSELSGMFDIIIFDTPPLGVFIDAATLAAKLDGAILVIADNTVETRAAKEVVNQLKLSGAVALGAIHNYIKQPRIGKGYYMLNYRDSRNSPKPGTRYKEKKPQTERKNRG